MQGNAVDSHVKTWKARLNARVSGANRRGTKALIAAHS